MLRGVLTAAVVLVSTHGALAADRPPTTWTPSEGNPVKVDGKPRWRADRVWPDDPMRADAYQPLPWRDGFWKATEHEHGGQPHIVAREGHVVISGRSAAPNRPGNKIPALVYIVPRTGWYGVGGTAKARIFDGGGSVKLLLLRRRADGVEKAREWQLPKDVVTPLTGVAVQADAGDELALVLLTDRAASDVWIRDLSIGDDQADDQVRAARERLAATPKSPAAEPTPEQIDAANAAVRGEGYVPQANSGVLNIRAFGAKGDGVHDDTAAFQLAMSKSPRMFYVPDGTYLISDTIRWGGRQTRQNIQGQSQERTVIKLVDGCPGYDDPLRPKAMVWTGQAPAQRFRNGLRNLTLDVGSDNPGATGLQYMANNQGRVSHLTIRSSDPQRRGVIGLDLGYSNEQGPCLIEHVTVEGFDTGVRTKYAVDGVVAEHITLRHQNKVG